MKPILETERLLLRELTEADAENVYLLNRSPSVTRYVGEPTLANPAEALTILRTRILPQYQLYGVGRWAVVLRDRAEFIGWCGLKYLPEADEYDLGYRFIESAWGKGYATEAAQAVLQHVAARLHDKRIVGKAMLENRGSIRVLEKLGLRFESYGQDHDGPIATYVVGQVP
jgi:RimJ/RimL family protein N-acetyltransferase